MASRRTIPGSCGKELSQGEDIEYSQEIKEETIRDLSKYLPRGESTFLRPQSPTPSSRTRERETKKRDPLERRGTSSPVYVSEKGRVSPCFTQGVGFEKSNIQLLTLVERYRSEKIENYIERNPELAEQIRKSVWDCIIRDIAERVNSSVGDVKNKFDKNKEVVNNLLKNKGTLENLINILFPSRKILREKEQTEQKEKEKEQ